LIIEFEEAKTELGMDHYEVRKYAGWHHHMLTTMLAHFFLWHLKLRLGRKSPSPYRVAAAHDLRGRLTPTEIYE
jgi:SRSO17 transposase